VLLAGLFAVTGCDDGGSGLEPNVDPNDNPPDFPSDGCDVAIDARAVCADCDPLTASWGTLTEDLYGREITAADVDFLGISWYNVNSSTLEDAFCDADVTNDYISEYEEINASATYEVEFPVTVPTALSFAIQLVGDDGSGDAVLAMGLFTMDAMSTDPVAVIDDDSAYAGQ
jgi:hypothetical protein